MQSLLTYGKTLTIQPTILHISKQYFTFFYATGLAFANVLWLPVDQHGLYMLIYFHLSRRLIETLLFPYSQHSKMHLFHALLGFSYYFFLVLGILICTKIPISNVHVMAFIILNMLQFIIHRTMFLIREQRSFSAVHQPLAQKSILFRYILSPHYLVEIFIYLFVAYTTAWSQCMLTNLLFVCCCLSVSAHETLKWYKIRFANNPNGNNLNGNNLNDNNPNDNSPNDNSPKNNNNNNNHNDSNLHQPFALIPFLF